MMKFNALCLSLLLVPALSACDDNAPTGSAKDPYGILNKSEQKVDTPTAAVSLLPVPEKEAPVTAPTATAPPQLPTAAPMPVADRNTPLDKYEMLDSGHQLMFHYLAQMATPIDYDSILNLYSPEYRRTSDGFKKQDLLNALKPKIDQETARAKASPYVKIEVGDAIGKYDFGEKGFPMQSSIAEPGTYRYFSDNSHYKMSFTNGDKYKFLRPTTEEDARRIEALRSKYERMKLIVYCFIQDADPSDDSVRAQITRIELLDNKGVLLLTAE